MGRGQKAGWSDFIRRTGPQEAKTERGRTKGHHRGHETALGGIPKDAVALIKSERPNQIHLDLMWFSRLVSQLTQRVVEQRMNL